MAATAASLTDRSNTLNTQEGTYYQRLEIASKQIAQDKLMRLNWINMMIDRIESAKKIIEHDSFEDLHPKVKEALKKYYVAEVINQESITEKKLFVKKENSKESWEAIPLTKTFPIVTRAHVLTGHGDINAMSKWLNKENVFVASICFSVIIEVCKDCAEKALVKPTTECVKANEQENCVEHQKKGSDVISENVIKEQPAPNSGQVFILDMTTQSINEKLDRLLIYQDIDTDFLQLRPVSSSDLVESIAKELMHVFSDMGPPDWLIVAKKSIELFDQVLERLNQIFKPEIKIKNREKILLKQVDDLSSEVESAIKNWLSEAVEKRWCMGCFVVQWELNNVCCKDGKSPFEKLLGRSQYTNRCFKDTQILKSIEDLSINNNNKN